MCSQFPIRRVEPEVLKNQEDEIFKAAMLKGQVLWNI